MSRILLTGGAGYIGSVCCNQLIERGHEVIVIDNLSTGHIQAVPAAAHFYELDYGDRAGIAKLLAHYEVDAVFHFAAKALIPESVTNPGLFFDVNVASAIGFLEAVRAAGIKTFVFSSSAAVYGAAQDVPIVEEQAKQPINSYGETKLMLERVLEWYAQAYGWRVFAFRYFNACGATADCGEDHQPETHIIPLLLQVAAGERAQFDIYGDDYPTMDGTCLRDYVHVSDIAAAHIAALESGEQAGFKPYNIGTGQAYTVRQVVRKVEEITGKKILVQHAPRRAGDPPILCASPAKLMNELSWRPTSSSVEQIIRSAWDWKQRHPAGYSTRSTQEQIVA